MAVTVEFVTRRARERTVRSISSLPAVLMIDMYIYMLVKYASVSQNNNRLVGLSIRFVGFGSAATIADNTSDNAT